MNCAFCAEAIPDGALRCSRCHKDFDRRSWWIRLATYLGRPVVWMLSALAGALITSWFVPGCARDLNRDLTLRETRLRLSHEITDQGTLVERDINNLTTLLGIFHQDAQTMTRSERRQAQRDVAARIAERYLAFERTAWWWYRKVQRDSETLLPTDKRKALNDLCDRYATVVGATTVPLNELWDRLLRKQLAWPVPKHDPDKEFVKERFVLIEQLGLKRRDYTLQMARLFEEPQRARWFNRLLRPGQVSGRE